MKHIQITVDGVMWAMKVDEEVALPEDQIKEVTELLGAVREYCLLSIAGLLPSVPDGEGSES